MGEKGTVVYLTDSTGRRYNPLPRSTDAPFSTRLSPGSHFSRPGVSTSPATPVASSLVYAHEGGFPIDWAIIGAGGWFQGPPIVHLY